MAAVVEKFQHDSHCKNIALCTGKMQNLQTEGAGELLKVLRRSIGKVNSMKSKSKQAEQPLKVLMKRTDTKVNIKESKASAESKRMCICAPPTHQGSFKCRFHRNSAPEKLATPFKFLMIA